MNRLSLISAILLMLAIGVLSSTSMAQNYEGTLRVYMVEPESRWTYTFGGSDHLQQAMIDFAFVEGLDIPSGSMVTFDTLWDASVCTGLSGVSRFNLEAIGAVFADTFVWADSYPVYAYWFELHEVDASASASPGVPGTNITQDGMTHSVFCEEATATWCVNCPTVAAKLHTLKAAMGTSMNYVALVDDMSAKAKNRITELNPGGYPSVYYDGGLVVQAGDTALAEMEGFVSTVGTDPVEDIGLVIRVDHVTNDQFLVVARVSNGIPANAAAVTPATPTSDHSGAAEETFHFQASATDGDGDDLFYQFDFGDGDTSDWLGPYSSGAIASVDHVFASEGFYPVSVRTQDVWAATSDWSAELSVTVDVASDVQRLGSDQLPDRLNLSNYPNPFNPTTVISFSLPRAGNTNLTIYNILGETVIHLVDDHLSAGDYEVIWDGTSEAGQSVTSGVYLYRLTIGNESLSRKMTLVK